MTPSRLTAVLLALQASNPRGLTLHGSSGDADPFYMTEDQLFKTAWYASQSGERDSKERAPPHPKLVFKEAMAGTWLYVRGDSTVRQVAWAEMGLFGQKMSQEELKTYVRSRECDRPRNMSTYNFKLHPSFGTAPCKLNEQKCDWYYANQSHLTYEWQHFLYDERDDYLFNPKLMRSDPEHDFHRRLPDVMIMGMPVHLCYHTNKQGFCTDTSKNITAERELVSKLPLLFENVRKVYNGPLFWLEAGGINHEPENHDYMRCVAGLNADLNELAAKDHDSVVIHRAQIEEDWLKEVPTDIGVHKQNECISRLSKQLNRAILKRLKPKEMAAVNDTVK